MTNPGTIIEQNKKSTMNKADQWDPWGGQSSEQKKSSRKRSNSDVFSFKKRGSGGGFGGDFGFTPPNKKAFLLGAVAFVLLWLASGFFVVQSDEEGIVLFFGKYERTESPGFHYHLPWPFETLNKVAVTRVHRLDVGANTDSLYRRGSAKEEASMLTGDENIVEANFSVFWVVDDARNFLFKVRDPEQTIRAAAESAIRDVIGQTRISVILTGGRGKIEQDIKVKLQKLMDDYHVGVRITQVQLQAANPPEEVIDSYRDVQAAKADQDRLKNEAETYRNKVVPEARGEAARIARDAEAYKETVIAKAVGEASRFDEIHKAYKSAPDLYKKRTHLDTMEKIMEGKNKILLDPELLSKGGSNLVPYLPLDKLKK